LLYKLLNSTHF